MKRISIAVALTLLATPLVAQDIDTRPYIFTQGHNNETQKVRFDRVVQVQLPSNTGENGDPKVIWGFDPKENPGVILSNAEQVDSPGRIEGYDHVMVFDFRLPKRDKVKISIQANDGNSISKTGEYELTLIRQD